MKKQIFILAIGIIGLMATPVFPMEDQDKQLITTPATPPSFRNNGSYTAPSSHHFEFCADGYSLRSPKRPAEWESYHRIRIAEIHNQYCPNFDYNYEDPEETKDGNFCFICTFHGMKPVGVIRIDLLSDQEAALRWVAITSQLQRKGVGSRMLMLAERFIKGQGRSLIRVASEENSQKFYRKLGYTDRDWPEKPENSGNILLAKDLPSA